MRIKIDERVLDSIKQRLINYFKFDDILINRLNDGCQTLYVENLKEESNALMASRKNEIVIDKSFVIFDENENIIGFDKNMSRLIESQLGHELLHSVSSEKRGDIIYNGIISHNSRIKIYIDYNCVGLNEGITQMYTEDAFGYVVSPFTDRYSDFKKIAKIMRLCLGQKAFFDSYFLHTDVLKKECDRLSGNNFYEILNKDLTNLYYLKVSSQNKKSGYKLLCDKIYNNKINMCFSDLIINLVIPKLNTLNNQEKKSFIKEILNVVNDDKERQQEIEILLSRFVKLDDVELSEEIMRLFFSKSEQKEKEEIISLLETKKINLIITDSGDISYLFYDSKFPIANDLDLCELVYSYLFESYFDNNFNLESYITIIKQNKKIIFPSNYNKKLKYILFSKIKEYALEKYDIILLNNYLECDKEELNLTYINKNISFLDLKILLNRYELKKEKNFIVVDKVLKKQIFNTNIINGVRFANLWLNTQEERNVTYRIELAFDESNEQIYNQLVEYMIKNLEKNGNLNYQEMYDYSIKYNLKMSKILQVLFQNPIAYEWVYKFISSKVKNIKLNIEKEKSLLENNLQYDDSVLDIKAREILK